MKAVVFEQHGGPEVLRVQEAPTPAIGPNDVLLRVKASAVNFNDIWARRGLPGVKVIFPHISGSDASGIVEEVGAGVPAGVVNVGDEVMVHGSLSCRLCAACTRGEEYFCKQFKEWGFRTGPYDGAHAEYARIPAVNVIPKPPNLTWEEAASFPLVLTTVWRMLVSRARIQPGDFVLIWGATGGLGVMAVQICKLFNAHAIAVSSHEEKLALARRLGADYTLNRVTDDIEKSVKEITNGRGVDICFEHVGESTWEQSVRMLRWGGTLVTCGATTGFLVPTDLRYLWNKQMNFLGSHFGSKAELLAAMEFVKSGQIRPVIHQALPMEAMAEAHTIMETSNVFGKIIISRNGNGH